MKRKVTQAQILLALHIGELAYSSVYEYKFLPDRDFRFDVYCEELRMGFECSGGRWKKGHRSARDIESAYEKMNLAQLAGYRVIEFTNEQVLTGRAKAFLAEHLKG